MFDGSTQTDLTLDVKLPKDLTLQEGTLTFDYSNSSYNRGDLTWEAKYQYWDGTTWQEFNFETNYEQSYVQQPTRLHLTTTITDVKILRARKIKTVPGTRTCASMQRSTPPTRKRTSTPLWAARIIPKSRFCGTARP